MINMSLLEYTNKTNYKIISIMITIKLVNLHHIRTLK